MSRTIQSSNAPEAYLRFDTKYLALMCECGIKLCGTIRLAKNASAYISRSKWFEGKKLCKRIGSMRATHTGNIVEVEEVYKMISDA